MSNDNAAAHEYGTAGQSDRLRWLSLAVDQSPAAIMITDLAGRIRYVNEMFTEITGFEAAEALGRTPRILQSGNTPREVYADLWRTIRGGRVWEGEIQNRRKDGELYWDWARITPIRDRQGSVTHYLACQEDVSERKQAEDSLRASEALFRQLAESVRDGFWLMDFAEEKLLYVNANWGKIWGVPVEEAYRDAYAWTKVVHPDDLADISALLRRLTSGESVVDTVRIRWPDGSTRWIRTRIFPVLEPDDGVRRIVGLSEDITERRLAEQRMEQAQRMESVGRLAGGIAHDFNNLLTVILAESQLMRSDIPADGSAGESLYEIRKAAERAAVLTRQMLAFSRHQVVEPSVFPVNDLVAEMESMLRRMIREDVVFTMDLSPDAGRVEVDRGQIEQVLANLVVNARDAMPDGGELTIRTANMRLDESYAATGDVVRPGEYIRLTVSDSGIGMTEEVRRHAFEPFFTTKPPGVGTGLGLSTSYGIIQQSAGHISVYSEPGLGTTVNLYLPRSFADETETGVVPEAEPIGGDETILLVEDELAVRNVGLRVLSALGYTMLEARDAQEALELLDHRRGEIDLLLSDVVLPGMSGRQLSEQVLAQWPETRVLFTSGYTDDVILQHSLLDDEYELLQKPFTADGLAMKVREVLDR